MTEIARHESEDILELLIKAIFERDGQERRPLIEVSEDVSSYILYMRVVNSELPSHLIEFADGFIAGYKAAKNNV